MKRVMLLLLVFIGFHLAEKVCHQQTAGFSILRVQTNAPYDPALSTPLEAPRELQQRFFYLASGKQCFVFASEDGKYVLKLFKHARIFPPAWTSNIPLVNQFKPFRARKIAKAAEKRHRDLTGYKVAFDAFRAQSGLLYIHLNPTLAGSPTISLRDKLQIEHRIDLNQACYVLQHRADPVMPKLKEWFQERATDKIEHALMALLNLCEERASKGIYDDDAALQKNFGFLGEVPIQTDPGQFALEATSKAPTEEVARIRTNFIRYLNKTSPELIPYVATHHHSF
jgi:hypothetical protein